MRHRAISIATFILALAVVAASRARATDGSIGVYADAAGTITHASFAIGQPTTLYIVARLEGQTADGASGFEFRVDGFPADWFASLTPNPNATLVLGDPLHANGAIHRVNLNFNSCQISGTGTVVLYSIFLVPSSIVEALELRVLAGNPPTNPNYLTPIVLRCNFPDFTPVAVAGESFVIDRVRAPQGLDYSLEPGYDGRRGVEPIMGLPGDTFHFRAAYSQINGQQLPAGQPILHLDGNGDGDTNDPGEGTYPLVPADHDSTTVDGKDYRVDVALAAALSGRWHYRFTAQNSQGQPATGPATVWNDSLFVSAGLMDLAVRSEDIIVGPSTSELDEPRYIRVRVSNESDVAVDDVVVQLERTDGAVIVSRTIAQLAPRGTGLLWFDGIFPTAGTHVLVARVDPENTISERDETNNAATHAMPVGTSGGQGQIAITMFPASFQDPPLEPFRVTGTARYSSVVGGSLSPSVAGARVTWAPSWDAANETRTDASGELARTFVAPASPGFYSIEVTVTDGARTRTATVPVQVVGALPVHGPNLVPHLDIAPSSACPGAPLVAHWSVSNTGDSGAGPTTVRLEMDGPQIVIEQSFGPVAAGGVVGLQDVNLGPATAGQHWLTARVDPGNAIAELHEEDGARTATLLVPAGAADLGVDSLQAVGVPCSGAPITFAAWIRNHGCAASAPTRIALRDAGVEGATVQIGALAPGATQAVNIPYTITTPSCHSLEVVVDPDAVPGADADPARNTLPVEACLVLCALPPDAIVNYRATTCDLAASNPRPQAGELISFIARVSNTGSTDAIQPVAVDFYLDGVRFGQRAMIGPILAGHTEVALSSPWPVDFAPHILRIHVDPANAQAEPDESDNEPQAVSPYDLALASFATCPPGNPSVFSNCSPCPLEPVAIHALVFNYGLFEADSVEIDFRDGTVPIGTTIATGPNLIDCNQVIPPGSVPSEIVHAFTSQGLHNVRMVVDPRNRWPEYEENNNLLSHSLNVLCGPHPDLLIQFAWPAGYVVPGGATVPSTPLRVLNNGAVAATDVHVRLTLDGQPLCEDLVVASVAPFSTADISCNVPWEAGFTCTQELEACVDPANLIPEPNETNNCATSPPPSSVCNGDQPDLLVEFAWPPNLIVPVGGTVQSTPLRILNDGSGFATEVHVRLLLDGQPLCNDLVVPVLLPHSSVTLDCAIPWVIAGSLCAQQLEACVDPNNLIPERTETNNCATSRAPTGTCDLTPLALTASPANPTPGMNVLVTIKIRDLLEHGAIGSVALYTYGDGTLQKLLGTAAFSAFPETFVSFNWTFNPDVSFFLVTLTDACPRDILTSNDARIFTVTGGAPGVPIDVSDLTATSTEDGVRLHWRALADIERFEVDRREIGVSDWQRLENEPRRTASSGLHVDWEILDRAAVPGSSLEYRLVAAINGGAPEIAATIRVDHTQARSAIALETSRPHPFRPGGALALVLPRGGEAVLTIYDAAGRRVAEPLHGALGRGRHEIRWDATDLAGRQLPAGVYFAELRAESARRVQRLVLMR